MTIPRLLPVQQNYLEGMKTLLGIYYLLKSLPNDQWFSDKVIKMIARTFSLTVSNFTKSVFYGDRLFYYLRYGESGTAITLDESQLKRFSKIFDDFQTEIVNGRIEEAYRVTRSSTSVDYLPIQNKELKHIKQDFYSPFTKITQSFSCKIYREKEPWYIKGKTDSSIYKIIHSNLSQLPNYHETFHVDLNFDSHLVYTLSASGPHIIADLPDQLEVIESPSPAKETSFCDAIRYVIAKFYTIFGSFDRIKVCLNNDCQKLFVEEKLGTFCCNMKCRMKYNVNRQPKQIRLCRERQNNWLRNQLKRKDITIKDIDNLQDPNHVHKSDCDNCIKQMKSGHCLCLQNKNSKSLLIIEKYPKRVKIMNKAR